MGEAAGDEAEVDVAPAEEPETIPEDEEEYPAPEPRTSGPGEEEVPETEIEGRRTPTKFTDAGELLEEEVEEED